MHFGRRIVSKFDIVIALGEVHVSIRSYLLLLCGVLPASAQIRSGTIVGSVVDPSGAAVAAASVTAVAEETNFSYSTASNTAGEFTVPYLPFGR